MSELAGERTMSNIMVRPDLPRPGPFTAKEYVLGNLLAAGVFLAIWAFVLLTEWSGTFVLVLSFPLLLISSLCWLIALSGWRQRLLGFVGWILLWSVAYFVALAMLFGILGPP
jgi:hypothetical protein